MDNTQLLLLLTPVIVIEIGKAFGALEAIKKISIEVGDSEFISLLGPILYLTVGRQEE